MNDKLAGRCEPCKRGAPPNKHVRLGNKVICGDCECVAYTIIAGPVYEGDQQVMYGYHDQNYVSKKIDRGLPGMTEKDYE